MTLGREEWRVGLDHQAVEWDAASDFAEVSTAFEGDDARERDHEALVHRALREIEGSRVAMEDAFEISTTLCDPYLEKFVIGVGVVAADVDRYGHVEFAGEGDLFGEDRSLCFAWRVHVVVVETALAQCHDPIVAEPASDSFASLVVEFGCLVRMDSDSRKDA
jgi:hypothetical protein